jgi:hypothetical protein
MVLRNKRFHRERSQMFERLVLGLASHYAASQGESEFRLNELTDCSDCLRLSHLATKERQVEFTGLRRSRQSHGDLAGPGRCGRDLTHGSSESTWQTLITVLQKFFKKWKILR